MRPADGLAKLRRRIDNVASVLNPGSPVMNPIEILVPVAASRIEKHPLAPRRTRLDGARVGWFDNRKANAGGLLGAVAAALAADGFTFESVRAAKNATAAAPDTVMAHLMTCDAVVLAIAD